jgi:ABC-type iron transport system FetAB ATPase subunit
MPNLMIQDLKYRTWGPFSLALPAGACIGLTGPSGSGKSLMLRSIADLDAHEGRLLLDGVDCNDMSAPQWRRRVGLLPAESQWWFDTVGPHFPSGNRTPSTPFIQWLAELGFDTDVLQWETSRLSSGEKQRLSLIRLLVNQPHVLLLDEPTSNLDRKSALSTQHVIAGYQREKQAAVLWVTHDLEQLDRVTSTRYALRDNTLREHRPS